MRKLFIISLGLVVILAGGGYLYFLSPLTALLLEARLERDCPQGGIRPDCISRMQAMGDVWSWFEDWPRAEVWYRRAAEQGNVVAMFQLGWIYQEYSKAALRSADARVLRETGQAPTGMATNEQRAREWYRLAADKGFAPAMNNLAELDRGAMDPRDRAEAMRWFLTAARAGNPIAMWNVAVAYASGQGVPHDPNEMRNWLSWDPKNGFDPRDLSWPTLEHTTLFGSPIPDSRIVGLRASAKAKMPVEFVMVPLKPNPAIPTFRQLTEQMKKDVSRSDR